MKREIIRSFRAWDRQLRSLVELSAGIVVSDYSIVRGGTAPDEPSFYQPSSYEPSSYEPSLDEPYRVEFQASGRAYSCGLPSFLPRTQSVLTLDLPDGPDTELSGMELSGMGRSRIEV